MSTISVDDVKKLALLSALSLSEDEMKSIAGDLDRILEYIDHLSEVNTDGTLPTYQVTGLHNVMRDDVIQEGVLSREDLLRNAPMTEKNQIKVPRVIE